MESPSGRGKEEREGRRGWGRRRGKGRGGGPTNGHLLLASKISSVVLLCVTTTDALGQIGDAGGPLNHLNSA